MAADPSLMAKARRALELDAAAHRRRLELWREQLYAQEPRLRELDARIRGVFLDAVASLSVGAVTLAAEQSLSLQTEREALLSQMGASPDSLKETPLCPSCNDLGYVAGEPCACLLERYQTVQAEELSSLLNLRGQSFDTFNADLFSNETGGGLSPRQNIDIICEDCYKYCKSFGPDSVNLLFSGPPGTGKTFLSSCVAGAINERGFSVVYDTAVRQLEQMEALHFGRGGEGSERAVRRLRECDLLIVDDLGAEFLTPFAQSALLDVVNTRIISNKKMLISTNLKRADVQARYSPALASRLLGGDFEWLDFFGKDLR